MSCSDGQITLYLQRLRLAPVAFRPLHTLPFSRAVCCQQTAACYVIPDCYRLRLAMAMAIASARLIPRLPVMLCAWAVHAAQIVVVLALALSMWRIIAPLVVCVNSLLRLACCLSRCCDGAYYTPFCVVCKFFLSRVEYRCSRAVANDDSFCNTF